MTSPHPLMGATAFVSHAPLVWPEFGLRLWDSLQEHRYADALAWIKRFRIGYTALLFKACDYTCSEAGMDKAALAMVGCLVGDVRPPARSLPTAFLDQIRKMLQDVGVSDLQEQ